MTTDPTAAPQLPYIEIIFNEDGSTTTVDHGDVPTLDDLNPEMVRTWCREAMARRDEAAKQADATPPGRWVRTEGSSAERPGRIWRQNRKGF